MDQKILDRIVCFRHHLHEIAELSGMEINTMQTLMEWIHNYTSAKIMRGDGWFYVCREVGPNAPSLVFRADMDALPIDETISLSYASKTPGTAHKCGHDGHMAALLGLILETEDLNLRKNLYFLFQPAEETGAGAPKCLSLLKEHPDAEIYGFHNIPGFPKGTILLRQKTFACASRGLCIHFEGTSSHAAYPEAGKNPAGAIAHIIDVLPEISNPAFFRGLILSTIVHANIGEKAFGVSAGSGELDLTIRAEREDELAILQNTILQKAQEECNVYGLSFSYETFDVFPETRNAPECTKKLEDCCRSLELPFIYPEEPMRWSEDFGHYLKIEKGAFFGIGDGETYPQLHTQNYDFPDEILSTAVDLYLELILS